MPGFWMAPYRGNQGNDRATSVLQVYRIRRAWSRVRNQLWVGQLHASDAHRGNSSGSHWGTVRVRVQMALRKDSKSPALLSRSCKTRHEMSAGASRMGWRLRSLESQLPSAEFCREPSTYMFYPLGLKNQLFPIHFLQSEVPFRLLRCRPEEPPCQKHRSARSAAPGSAHPPV